MILVPGSLLGQITAAAETAFPGECCGLLAGRARGEDMEITRAVASPNIALDGTNGSFEVDPKLRLDLMRRLDGGDERIVGHYHSHPGGGSEPSQRDINMAFEPELVWLIVPVIDGRAAGAKAYFVDREGGGFREAGLRIVE